MGSDGPRVSCVRWGSRSPHVKGRFWGIGVLIVKYRDFLPWAVQKRQNRLICHLGCGLHWAEACTRSVIFAKWRQSAPQHSSMSCAKMAQPIDCSTNRFAVWVVDWNGLRKYKLNRIRQSVPMCPHGRTHCCLLANTIEPSVCIADVPYAKLLSALVIFGHAHLDSRTDSWALRAEYCIVGIPHDTGI